MQATEMSFFLAIVKHGTISAAARTLGISAPALSKRLAQIEQRLGVRLINRTTRSMHLTQEGQLFQERASRLLAEFETLEQDIMNRRREPSGVLRVNAPLNFGRVRIAPLISAFGRAYPKLVVELVLSDHPYKLVEEGFDVGIRFGTQPDSGMRARRILSNRRRLWASPAYLKRYGMPSAPKDLPLHQCIVVPRSDDTYGVWTFSRGDSVETIKVRGNLRCNDSEVALAWALEGHGILMRSTWDTGRFARTDALRVVLGDYALPNRDLFIVFHSKGAESAKVRTFIDFLVEHLPELDIIESKPAGAKSTRIGARRSGDHAQK